MTDLPKTSEAALAELSRHASPEKSEQMAAYHKIDRPYLGVANPDIDSLARTWRQGLSLDARLSFAKELWDSNIHEGRVAAAKLLTQARIRPDDQSAWDLIKIWVPEFDAWAVADHASIAGQKRLLQDPSRLDEVEAWTGAGHMWTRRAALVMTLPWARVKFPKPEELAARERILGWAAGYVEDAEWFIQKCVAWWLRDLSKRDPERTRAFLETHGSKMKGFARREASKYLPC